MSRFVVVNESTSQTTATPYSNHAEAKAEYRRLCITSFLEFYGNDDDEEYDDMLAALDKGNYDCSEVLMLDEGKAGVWTGFSSADRCSLGGELPFVNDGDFIGNGDPNLYLTVGQPDGTRVPVTPSVLADGSTHPLYFELGGEEDDEQIDEDDEAPLAE
jgi:hypothetical protein